MAIWRSVLAGSLLLIGSCAVAQDLVNVPVQIPSISFAVSAFALARDRGYYRQEGSTLPVDRDYCRSYAVRR